MPTYLPPFDIADDALAKQWRQWQPKDFAPNGGNGKNDKNGNAINTFMEVAEGKQIGEILYLGSLMRDYIMYSTGK